MSTRRPTIFTEEMANTVLMRMREGETLKAICMDSEMPTTHTVWEWTQGGLGAPSEWQRVYARARLDQADGYAADILTIADHVDDNALASANQAVADLDDDSTATEKRRAFFYAKKRSVEAAKLQISTRQWTAARMHPSRWGDSVTLNHTTNADSAPVKLDLSGLSTAQLESLAKIQSDISSPNESATNVEVLPNEAVVDDG